MTNPPDVLPGVQPEEDGRLQCLACGAWYRLLPPHLSRAHQLSAAAYREAHQLPRKLSLRASDLGARAREQGIDRYASRPDIRAHMAAGRTTPDAAAASGNDRSGYTLNRQARRRGGAGKAAAARRRINARAQVLGFSRIEDYFAARPGISDSRMAAELGVSRSAVAAWRERAQQPVMLTDLVGHLLDVADGAPGDVHAPEWRAAVPGLVEVEQSVRRDVRDVVEAAPASGTARRAAYLAAVVTHGGDLRAAAQEAGVSLNTVHGWRTRHSAFRPAEEAVRQLALTSEIREDPRPLTPQEIAVFLECVGRAVPAPEAARMAGRRHSAFRWRRARDAEFAQAWDDARVLRGRPPAQAPATDPPDTGDAAPQ